MIAFPDDLPMVQLEGGRVVPFEQDWLNRNLTVAAAKAGYPNWWLAEHVAQSVTSYLKNQCEEEVLGIVRLSKAVRSVLQMIGYAEVADHFVPQAPPLEISLVQLAVRAGCGYELLFFDLLRREVEDMRARGVAHFRFAGLRECVKKIRATRSWAGGCNLLGDEIVAFLRMTLQSSESEEEVTFSVV